MKLIPRRRKLVKDAEKEVARIVAGSLDAQRKAVEKRLATVVGKADAPTVPRSVFVFSRKDLARIFRIFERVYIDGAERAAKQLAEVVAGSPYAVEEFRELAADWAAENGAKLVKGVSESTRAWVNSKIEAGIREGSSVSEIADSLASGYTFSQDRALVIANTETARADVQGNLGAYKQAEVKRKRWILGAGACELCQANAAQGAIPFDDAFLSGDQAPPSHPNCRCDILPVLD